MDKDLAVFALARIPGERTTDLLISLYDSGKFKRTVTVALSTYPPDAKTKHIYLDIFHVASRDSIPRKAVEAAMRAVLDCRDTEEAILTAIEMATLNVKANCGDANRRGKTLLKQLPREQVHDRSSRSERQR